MYLKFKISRTMLTVDGFRNSAHLRVKTKAKEVNTRNNTNKNAEDITKRDNLETKAFMGFLWLTCRPKTSLM
jgi:hypothetical protein